MRPAVFLDRDGVLLRATVRDRQPFPPSGIEDMQLLPGVLNACRRLKAAGFALIVVTNQPDVARGTQTRENVDAMHVHLRSLLPLDDIRTCFHDDRHQCSCRKPLPGLLLDAARDWGIDLAGSYLVGDRWRDIEAGQAAGCRTVLIDYAYRESHASAPDITVSSLSRAANWILQNRQKEVPPHEDSDRS